MMSSALKTRRKISAEAPLGLRTAATRTLVSRSPCRVCIHERPSSRSSPFGEPGLIGANVHSLENDEVDRRARLSEKRASDCQLKPFATLTPCRAWGSSPFGVRLAAYDSRLLQLCRSSDIHGTLDATKPRCTAGAASWLRKP